MFPGSIFNIISTFINYSKHIENFKNYYNDNTYNHKAWFIIYVILLIVFLIILFYYLLVVPWKYIGQEFSDDNIRMYRLLFTVGFLFFPIANIIGLGTLLNHKIDN